MYGRTLSYNTRSTRQQKKQKRKKFASSLILNKIDSTDSSLEDESTHVNANDHGINDNVNILETIDAQQITETALESRFDHNIISNSTSESDEEKVSSDSNAFLLSSDSETPLYQGSCITAQSAAKSILSLAIEFNLSKSVVDSILSITKSLLPMPNSLPATYDGMMKSITNDSGHYTIKYFCNHCNQLLMIRFGKKFCQNERCPFVNRPLGSRDISEIVTFDIRHQLQSILSRNISVLGKMNDFQSFDIHSGIHYQDLKSSTASLNNNSDKPIRCITLNIHTDGAPLIRTSKAALWPCMGSIVDLPHHIREQQTNIVILALWISSTKPDIDIFMHDSIQQLLDMAAPFTIFINGLEYTVIVKTQVFISDLPAKAHFWRTINYNGYNACTCCLSEGIEFL